ncbi:MAG TPA: ABC transporter permease [Alphaproteobacteria bacterium]|nr:ABC transporter permease [Alphaproteobacteria bacterium]
MSAARILAPLLLVLGLLALWEGLVYLWQVPAFVLPAPSAIGQALYDDFPSLAFSAWLTLRISLTAFALAVLGGVALAVLFSQSRAIEMALFPLAVILQVTPIVAIAPLIVIWAGIDNPGRALLLMAWIAAFFPVLSNMTLGLRAADHGLLELYRLYGASRWQVLIQVRMPSALPYLLPALKISGGLALIGTVVAEFVAGSGASMGLAWRIMESGNRLQISRMFAALLLLSLLGIAVFFCLSALEYLLLRRWHESRVVREV